MRNVKDRLKDIDKKEIQKKWEKLDSDPGLSTKEKLDRLVRLNLKREHGPAKERAAAPVSAPAPTEPFVVRDFFYSLNDSYRKVRLTEWRQVEPKTLALLSGDERFLHVDPTKLLFFDTETTGIAGGTGTLPFMLGFGFLAGDSFQVRIFVLKDLNREGEFLEAVDRFLDENGFSALVTFNGRSFDLPLMETRYILQHMRCPMLGLPHLDFLFPARTIWRNTYDSRRLGYLGEMLLGISRSDDIDPSEIPALYFSFLRSNEFALLESVIEHNSLDLVGLSAVVLLGARYLEDYSLTSDEGEILGLGIIYEKAGWIERASDFYRIARENSSRDGVFSQAVKRLSIILKKQKLYGEAIDLWRILSEKNDADAFRELSVHYEHRERKYQDALAVVEMAFERLDLTEGRRQELEKRLQRLRTKIARLQAEEL